ncbi:hypothetical protein D3C72_1682760 [compost metagenome]
MIALDVGYAVVVFGIAVLIAFHRFPRHVIKRVKSFCRVAIAQQLEVGAKVVQRFRIKETQGLPFVTAVIGQLAASMS